MRRALLVAAERGSGPLLVRDDAWAPGLVGLVAGRLADSLARPVAAATLVGDEVRGSVRAPADFHVAAALEACAALLTKRGGHAAAGGFSLLPESWADFSAAFAALPRPFPADAAAEAERPGPGRRGSRAAGAPPRLDARRRARASRAVRAGPRRAGPGGHRHGAHRGSARRRRPSSTSRCGCAGASRPSTRSPSGSSRSGRSRSRETRSTSSARSSATTSAGCLVCGCASSTSRTDRRAR